MFKPGDKVVVIDGPQKGEKVRTLKNRIDSVFLTNFPVRIENQHYDAKGYWYAGKVCLRHATPEEIAASKKPIRRGDLVEFNGDICVVISEVPDRGGDYWVASLTGKSDHYWANIDEFTRIGSIRKKIKRIKNEMEGRNAT